MGLIKRPCPQIIGVIREITERKQAEEAMRESEERLRTVLENLPGGVFAHDLDGRLLLVNEAACKNTGYSQEELLNMSVADIDPSSVTRNDRSRLWHSLSLGESITIESTHIRKDGSQYPAEIHLNAVTMNGKRIILPIAFDFTDRKRAEENLEKEFHMRTTLLDNIPGCIALILKKDTHEIVASNKLAREVGAVPGQTCFKTCAMRDDNCPFCLAPKLWTTGQLQRLEVEYRGTWYEGIWAPLSEDLYVHYIFDITERKKMEEVLLKSNKLESLGTLAGGIAHDFNNLLSIIMVNLSMAEEDIKSKTWSLKFLKAAEEASNRAKDLTARLITFSKGGKPVKSVVSIKIYLRILPAWH